MVSAKTKNLKGQIINFWYEADKIVVNFDFLEGNKQFVAEGNDTLNNANCVWDMFYSNQKPETQLENDKYLELISLLKFKAN